MWISKPHSTTSSREASYKIKVSSSSSIFHDLNQQQRFSMSSETKRREETLYHVSISSFRLHMMNPLRPYELSKFIAFKNLL